MHLSSAAWSETLKNSEGLKLPPHPKPQGSMLIALEAVERELLPLLKDPAIPWKSVDVNYHPPRVERLWLQQGEYRISLHCIHPCTREEALLHPHPWPSAMRILSGKYEMGVGYADGTTAPPLASTLILPPGSSYEMCEPDGWHYVRPLNTPAYSIMLSGKPWNRAAPKSTEQLTPLTADRIQIMKDRFIQFYHEREK